MINLKDYFNPELPLPDGNQWKPGVFLDLPEAVYRAFPGLNSTLLKNPTAAEMWHAMNEPAADHWATDSAAEKWTMGTLIHWAVLEPKRFANFRENIVLSPTKGLATARAAAVRAAYPEKLLVHEEHIELALKCRQALEMNGTVRALMDPEGSNEVSVLGWDREAGVWRKARFDRMPFKEDYLLDVKSTAFPPPQFAREAKKLGYHLQAQWYLDTYEMITGERKRYFRWIVVNKEPPFMSQVWQVENYHRGHANRRQSPLGFADEVLGKRLSMWTTAAWEMIEQTKYVSELTDSLVRQCWPAYENDEIQYLTM